VQLVLERVPDLGRVEFRYNAAGSGDNTDGATMPEGDAQLLAQLETAVFACLSRGPNKFHPVVDARVTVEAVTRGPTTTPQGLVVAVTDATRKLLARVGTEV
jgi:hypothetical protein